VDYSKEENVGFPSAMIQDTIQKHVMIMVNTLWYIDEKNKNISKKNIQQAYVFATIRKDKEIKNLLKGVLDVKID